MMIILLLQYYAVTSMSEFIIFNLLNSKNGKCSQCQVCFLTVQVLTLNLII